MKQNKKLTAEAAAQMQASDRKRLILMAGAVIVLGFGYLYTNSQKRKYQDEEQQAEQASLPTEDNAGMEGDATILVPVFDIPEVLDAVRDAQPSERVVVDGKALTTVFNYGRLLTLRHYAAAGVRDLTPELRAEIEADPGKFRVKPFRVRGWIESIGKRRRAENLPEEWAGSLRLEDESYAHFVTLEVPAASAVGDFVAMHGMFLKMYSTEASAAIGGRLEGPLLLGPELTPSFPELDLTQEISLASLADVRDDTAGDIHGIPEDALWELLALAKAGNSDVDWATVPAIDGQVIGDLLADGDAYRGKPFRFDISVNMGGWTESAGENALRLERLTLGWVGNQTWKGQVPIIKYYAPMNRPEFRERTGETKYLTGHGYFLKNHVFERGGGGIGRAPLFVFDEIEVFAVHVDAYPEMMMWGVFAGAILMVSLLWFLLRRDRKKSAVLQQELMRRRRARRDQLANANAN